MSDPNADIHVEALRAENRRLREALDGLDGLQLSIDMNNEEAFLYVTRVNRPNVEIIHNCGTIVSHWVSFKHVMDLLLEVQGE